MRLKFLPSFVKRRGRITKKQEHSLQKLGKYSIKSLSGIVSLSKDYDYCVLEIGFGNSEYLQREALENPSTLYIGSEVYLSGIGTLIGAIEENKIYQTTVLCEPQLGKRGLYPNLGTAKRSSESSHDDIMALLAYSDGKNSLLKIAEIHNKPIDVYYKPVLELIKAGLLKEI